MYDENRKKYFIELAGRVRGLVEGERLYLHPGLSLDDVADRLADSRYNVSHAVNNYLGRSFISFVNELRIEELKSIMMRPEAKKLRIDEVARLAGFKDRTSLHRVCVKITGLNATQLKKQINQR